MGVWIPLLIGGAVAAFTGVSSYFAGKSSVPSQTIDVQSGGQLFNSPEIGSSWATPNSGSSFSNYIIPLALIGIVGYYFLKK